MPPYKTPQEEKAFIERTLQEYQEELVKKISAAGRIYGESPLMWPHQEKVTFTTEDFDGTNERQWVRVWNAALEEALSLIKDKI